MSAVYQIRRHPYTPPAARARTAGAPATTRAMPQRPWTRGPSRTLARTRILRLDEVRFASAADPARAGDFTVVHYPDWINVIALTPDRRVVMVEQFRFGTAELTLEIPGGVVEPGEDPAETCRRELMEETGYAGGPVRLLGKVSANPAVQTNFVHTGLIEDARPAGEVSLDEHEEIAVHLVPLADVPRLIREGRIHHAYVVAAFHWLALRA